MYIKQTKMFFFSKKEHEGKTLPVWGLVPVGRQGYKEKVSESERGGQIMPSCM
jgi:hypothetical protein